MTKIPPSDHQFLLPWRGLCDDVAAHLIEAAATGAAAGLSLTSLDWWENMAGNLAGKPQENHGKIMDLIGNFTKKSIGKP